jgi:Tol biopolymer transport system component
MHHLRACCVLFVLLAGCSTQTTNPFTNFNPSVPPPAGATILFAGNGYAARTGEPRELFSIDDTGGGLTRLTFCNTEPRRCDTIEAAMASDRVRGAARRVADADGDGRLSSNDGESLFLLDLTRGIDAMLFAGTARVSGIDWSVGGDLLVYSAVGEGGSDDIYRVDSNGQNNTNLTLTAGVRERRPRLDAATTIAAYERIEGNGKAQIYIFTRTQQQVTSGGEGSGTLANTLYVVGSDTDPDFSPDALRIVFRRLTGTARAGGTWDIVTVAADGSGLTTIVGGGGAFRGAPDWGPRGIIFPEADATGTRLVLVQPDGSGRRTLVTLGAGYDISVPRWLP